MRVYSAGKIAELKKHRRLGYSIQELMARFSMPKTSIWYHIHSIELGKEQKERIKSRQGGSKIRTQKQWYKAKGIAHQVIKEINAEKTAPIILSALYWAEGSKNGFVFTNTDADMIKIFLKILRESFGVTNNNIAATIRINASNDGAKCIRYWRKVTNIPWQNMGVNINSKQNKSKSKYGILRLTIKKGGRLLKIVNSLNAELTSRVLSSILDNTSPLVAQMD